MTLKEFIRINKPRNFACINHVLEVNSDTPYSIDLAVVNSDMEGNLLYLFTEGDSEEITSMRQLKESLLQAEADAVEAISKGAMEDGMKESLIHGMHEAVNSFIVEHFSRKKKSS